MNLDNYIAMFIVFGFPTLVLVLTGLQASFDPVGKDTERGDASGWANAEATEAAEPGDGHFRE